MGIIRHDSQGFVKRSSQRSVISELLIGLLAKVLVTIFTRFVLVYLLVRHVISK